MTQAQNSQGPPLDSALIVVDAQNDFTAGGSLATQYKQGFIQTVNQLITTFKIQNLPIVFTQDWHPEGHLSFASSHNEEPFTPYEDNKGIGPVLWPDHCIQGTLGAEFVADIDHEEAWAIIRKGYRMEIDSYSGFVENDGKTETGLYGFLQSLNVNRVYVCGLAYDYCVYFTAKDARIRYGYETYLIENATQYVDVPEGSVYRVTKDLEESGVNII